MLTTDQQFILQLLRKSLKENTREEIAVEDFCNTGSIITHNGIILTVFYKLPTELETLLNSQYLAAIKQAIVQDYEGEQILQVLSDAGLFCIALKGWELRKLYP